MLLECFDDNDRSPYTSRASFREVLASCSQQLREAAAKVLVKNLQLTDAQTLEKMKEVEMENCKHYTAVCS